MHFINVNALKAKGKFSMRTLKEFRHGFAGSLTAQDYQNHCSWASSKEEQENTAKVGLQLQTSSENSTLKNLTHQSPI